MKHILIMGEDPRDHELFNVALNQFYNNTHCVLTTSESDALDFLSANKPDIVFVNADYPGFKVLKFIKAIRKMPLHYTTCLVVFADNLTEAKREDAGNAGATLSFETPETREEFLLLFEFIGGFADVRYV